MMLKLLLAFLISTDHPILSDAHLEALIQNYGQSIPIKTAEGLGEALYWANLVQKDATTVEVTDKLIRDVVAVRRFHQRARYNVGDRLIVRASEGGLSPRAEIATVNPDGTYDVIVWDKLKSFLLPNTSADATRAMIDEATGELAKPGKTQVEVTDPVTGVKKKVWMERPWLERPNLRTVKMTHTEIAALNGPPNIAFRQRYNVYGYIVDAFTPGYDPVLEKRLAKAVKVLDQMVAKGELDLRWPENPAEQPKFMEKLLRAQRKLIRTVWSQNEMSYLRGDEASKRWNEAMSDPTLKEGYSHKVGAQLKARVGVCSDQTAGITSVLREIGRRAGFEIRPVSGRTLDGGGHAFAVIRLADGKLHLIDPSWHSVSSHTKNIALESIDFATFDKRWWSNRDLGSFVETSVETPRKAGRGFTDTQDALFRATAKKGLGDVAARPIERTWMEEMLERYEVYEPAEPNAVRWRRVPEYAVWAEPITDSKIGEAVDIMREHGAGKLADLILRGDIRVYWVEPRSLGSAGAITDGRFIYVTRGATGKKLALELVHEATHAEGFLRTGRPASEVQAFRAEAAFAQRAGVKSVFRHDKISRMSDAELAREIERRWPDLYTSAREGVPARGHRARIASAAKTVGRGAMGAGIFAAGFLVKETIQGIWHGDWGRIKSAVHELKSPWFLGGFAVFSGVEYASAKMLSGTKGMWGSVGRFALPLYAGVALLQLAQGKRDLKSIATEATSFAASALAMMPVMNAIRGSLYPALAAAPPWGWVGIGAIEIANAAVMLWGAEKMAPYVDKAITATVSATKKAASWVAEKATGVWHDTVSGFNSVRRGAVSMARRLKFW